MSSHWYSAEGNLYGQVSTQKGSYRDFNLSDARKNGALPSVTTILGLLAKPGLVRWQVEQGIKAAWEVGTWAKVNELLAPETISIIYNQSQEYTRYTQDFGIATHWWVNKKLRAVETNEIPPMIAGSEEVADGVLAWLMANGYSFTHTEHRFARPDLGYAGTIDLVGTHWDKLCVVDLKTQEPPLTPYLEHSLQLAGYDMALEPATEVTEEIQPIDFTLDKLIRVTEVVIKTYARERISLIANRLNPGEIKEHIWRDKDSTIEATNARYDAIWMSLVNLWMGINQYDPRAKQELEDDQATTLEYLLEELASD